MLLLFTHPHVFRMTFFLPQNTKIFWRMFLLLSVRPKTALNPIDLFYIDKFLFCFPKKVRFGTTGGLLVDSSFKSLTYLKLLAERCCWGKISGLSSELWGLSPLGGPMTFFIPPGSRSRSSSGCLWIVVVFLIHWGLLVHSTTFLPGYWEPRWLVSVLLTLTETKKKMLPTKVNDVLKKSSL